MKKAIIVMVIVIVIIIAALYLISVQGNQGNENIIDTGETSSTEVLEPVKDADRYYTVKGCVDSYIAYVTAQDSESIYKLLDKDYIQDFGITQDNVMEYVEQLDGMQIVQLNKMYEQSIENNIKVYYAEGYIREDVMEQETEREPYYITVKLDDTNGTFSIMPFGYMDTMSIQKNTNISNGSILVDRYDLYYNKCEIYLTVTNSSNTSLAISDLSLSYVSEQEAIEHVSDLQIEAGQTETLKLVFNNDKMKPETLQFSDGTNTYTVDLIESM